MHSLQCPGLPAFGLQTDSSPGQQAGIRRLQEARCGLLARELVRWSAAATESSGPLCGQSCMLL